MTVSEVERLIQQHVDRELPALRKRFDKLHPLEAMALLGNLTIDAFARMEPAERMTACNAWLDTLREGVRDSLS